MTHRTASFCWASQNLPRQGAPCYCLHMQESVNPIQVHCSLEDSLRILSKWRDKESNLYVIANVGPAKFSLTGKTSLIERHTVHIESGSHRFSLGLSDAMFTFEDNLEWPESRKRSLPEGVTPVSALIANLFVEKQLVGDCILMELQKRSHNESGAL